MLDPVVTISVAVSEKSPFLRPFQQRDRASAIHRSRFGGEYSDFLALWRVYQGWEQAGQRRGVKAQRAFCEENFLSFYTLQSIQRSRSKLMQVLVDMGVASRTQSHGGASPANPVLVNAVLCIGLFPNICRVVHPEAQYQNTVSGAVRVRRFLSLSDYLMHTFLDVPLYSKRKTYSFLKSVIGLQQGSKASEVLHTAEEPGVFAQ